MQTMVHQSIPFLPCLVNLYEKKRMKVRNKREGRKSIQGKGRVNKKKWIKEEGEGKGASKQKNKWRK